MGFFSVKHGARVIFVIAFYFHSVVEKNERKQGVKLTKFMATLQSAFLLTRSGWAFYDFMSQGSLMYVLPPDEGPPTRSVYLFIFIHYLYNKNTILWKNQ